MIEKENNVLNVSMLCDIAQVSRSGYYNWIKSKNNRIQKENNDRLDF